MIFGNACATYPGMATISSLYFICSDAVWDMNHAHDLLTNPHGDGFSCWQS